MDENLAESEVLKGIATDADAVAPATVAQDAPLTKETFSEQMKRLADRATTAGLNPMRLMAAAYAARFMAVLNGVLGALEDGDSPKKKE